MNRIFQSIRKAFHLPEKGKLSENTCDDEISHKNCGIFIGQHKEIVKSGFTHEMDTTKQIIFAYEKWEEHLFALKKEGTIPRTNNSLEQFSRKIRRNVRKGTGNLATGKLLSHNVDKLAIFQNIGILDYVKLVFGSINIAAKFGSCRKGLKKYMIYPMTRKKILELVDKGKKNLISGTLRNNPYSDELMEKAGNVRIAELIQGT